MYKQVSSNVYFRHSLKAHKGYPSIARGSPEKPQQGCSCLPPSKGEAIKPWPLKRVYDLIFKVSPAFIKGQLVTYTFLIVINFTIYNLTLDKMASLALFHELLGKSKKVMRTSSISCPLLRQIALAFVSKATLPRMAPQVIQPKAGEANQDRRSYVDVDHYTYKASVGFHWTSSARWPLGKTAPRSQSSIAVLQVSEKANQKNGQNLRNGKYSNLLLI